MPEIARTPELAASFVTCRAIARQAGGSFAAGMRLCPGHRRDAMLVVYAWTRTADDLADEPGRDAETRRTDLAQFREHTIAALAGDPDPASIWPAVSATAMRYDLDPRWCTDLLEGVESDVGPRQPETLADLLEYCRRVASTVGLMCVRIWGTVGSTPWTDIEPLAIRRGHALQLTNIVRDLGDDMRDTPSRTYMPAEVLRDVGITADELAAWSSPAQCAEAVGALTAEAARAYDDSAPLARLVDPACLPVLDAMSSVYARYLDVLTRDPQRAVLGPRVRLTKAQRAVIAGRAWVAARTGIAASVSP